MIFYKNIITSAVLKKLRFSFKSLIMWCHWTNLLTFLNIRQLIYYKTSKNYFKIICEVPQGSDLKAIFLDESQTKHLLFHKQFQSISLNCL